jgi:hypothetical protein
MPPQAKAHCFSVAPREGNSVEILKLLRSYAKKKSVILIEKGDQRLCICEPHLRKLGDSEVFTTSVFRVRSNAFPSVVGEQGPEHLSIPEGTGLGEPMCFAYDPVACRALIFCSQNGPRHSAIPLFLKEVGFPHEVEIEPLFRHDMMDRLDKTRFVQSLLFKLKGVPGNPELRNAGAPVATAIELAESVGGVDILVEVSIGATKRGLALEVVKKAATFLHDFGSTHVDQLQLNAAEAEELKCEKLDLLNARIEILIDVTHELRELDRGHCQAQLARALKEKLPGILKRAPD